MTQKDIADACRTQQSVVHKWKKGESKGTEEQFDKLIKKYGPRLNRTTSRLYLSMDAPDARWEKTQLGQQIVALYREGERLEHSEDRNAHTQHYAAIKELWAAAFPWHGHDSFWSDHLGMLLDHVQVVFASTFPTRISQVEGPIVFRYSFCRLEPHADRRGIDVPRVPVSRWSVHDGQLGKLVLVRQYRAALPPDKYKRWEQELDDVARAATALEEQVKTRGGISPITRSRWVESADDAAKWVSRVEAPMTVEQLLSFVDDYIADPGQLHNPHDELVLPFLMRKSLVEHGHQVPGVEKISGCE